MTPATMRNDDSKAEGLNETDMSVFFGENNEFHKDQVEQEWRKRFLDIKQNPENVKQLMLWVQAIMMDLLLTDNADHWQIWDARWEKLSKLIKMMNFDFSASQRPNGRELAGTAQKERVRIKLRLLVTETSRNRKKKENRGKIDSHQARLFAKKRKPVEYLL